MHITLTKYLTLNVVCAYTLVLHWCACVSVISSSLPPGSPAQTYQSRSNSAQLMKAVNNTLHPNVVHVRPLTNARFLLFYFKPSSFCDGKRFRSMSFKLLFSKVGFLSAVGREFCSFLKAEEVRLSTLYM